MPIKFTQTGAIELWRASLRLSTHTTETKSVEAAIADWEANGGAGLYTLKYPNKEVDLSRLTRVIRDVDATRPNAPSGLTGTPVSETQINLSWSAASDPAGAATEAVSGIAGYRLYRNGTLRVDQSGVTFNDTGLTAYTTYTYAVLAYDAAGNVSVLSSSIAPRTLDTTAPSAPVITATQTGTSSISVALTTPSTDANSGVSTYRLEYKRTADSTWTLDSASLTAASFPRSITGLTSGTSYDARCRATDASSNVGNFSATSSATTTSSGSRTETTLWPNGSVVAASASLADVQAAVNAAVDGQRVLIPNGSATWTGGISTTKKILIRAQNYTPTAGGTLTRNVTITNNAGTTPLISMVSGNTYHVGIAGIRFNDGSGTGNYVAMSGSGSKVPLVNDVTFEFEIRNGNNPTNAFIAWLSLGGVLWNVWWRSTRNTPSEIGGESMFLESPRGWQTASTMGMDDTNGDVNVYVENSTAIDIDAIFDVDQGSRIVVRNSAFDGTWFLTHGFTSGVYHGGRHVEIYNNTFSSSRTDEARNLAGRYFWLRAGTVLITDNVANGPVRTQDYGPNINILQIGDNTAPSGSDGAMQPGWGHNGTTDIREPMYVWNNTGAMGSSVGFNNSSGNWQSVTNVASSAGQANGELFVNLGAKPGYTKFTYPHSLRYTAS